MKQLTGFQCEYCDEIFTDKIECAGHESRHLQKDNLEITELAFTNHEETPDYNYNLRVGIFPSELIIENKHFSGCAAKYKLIRVASVEEIYPDND